MLTLPKAGALFNLMAVLPMQLLAYHLSLARGYDPDYPRNISKTLTME
jgi:glucosamine--fructose-6-phosphate aminotransferase (isomerizing)